MVKRETMDDEEVTSEINYPEIVVRFGKESVLIRISCKMQKSFMTKIISEIENRPLSITNINVMPFDGIISEINIGAQVI